MEYVEPPSTEYSSATWAMEPVLVHVMFSVVFTTHVSPPFGALSTTLALIWKFAFDASFTVSSAREVIFTRHSVDGVFATGVQS